MKLMFSGSVTAVVLLQMKGGGIIIARQFSMVLTLASQSLAICSSAIISSGVVPEAVKEGWEAGKSTWFKPPPPPLAHHKSR